MHGCTFQYWVIELQDPDNSPDELMLYCLSCTYNCHTLVVCKNRYWSTLEIKDAITEEELFNQCHIKLVYLGDGIFGELKRKPYSQNLNNPIMTEHETSNLMKIRGVGRPMKRPLNLSTKPIQPDTPGPSQPIPSAKPDSSTSVLDNSDRAYLGLVITNLQQQKLQGEEEQVSQSGIENPPSLS